MTPLDGIRVVKLGTRARRTRRNLLAQHQVTPGTTGALSFHTRVAANLLAALERELDLGE